MKHLNYHTPTAVALCGLRTGLFSPGSLLDFLIVFNHLERLRQGERLLGRVVLLPAHPARLAEEHRGVEHVAAVHVRGPAGGLVPVEREEPPLGVHCSTRALQPALRGGERATRGADRGSFATAETTTPHQSGRLDGGESAENRMLLSCKHALNSNNRSSSAHAPHPDSVQNHLENEDIKLT